uniref:Histone deacetylase complex subunit SAP18 n=1 Tax=Pyramimonas obovata TaxID=1411642 RepID=A0A7S0RGX5_9CHLO|mmetsp:Transcript_3405/g.7089  ORF Transcript_3405/g.7089 Transcript_3405/m.7089 type:complete len:157 (+) Transcript_3405:133-603(+)|eukprot:CAMPEP_0118935014 /NCGR_PEP_ID=MMETSP1169-20130426/14707_1 /TAXON_ID=36882 /ORGANISM="Pyramimonas obovata, Strain CCMP722" /LENGTH=156 /DNA_ID=CAMNT_0006877993 /DNA_START=106 /DNA_END=576 /DNA_ORIENTATION=+
MASVAAQAAAAAAQDVSKKSGGPAPKKAPVEIDREKICPLLLRVFPKVGGLHRPEDFATRGKEPKEEVQIYTWPDATLRELTELVKEVRPEARKNTARLEFALVYPDRMGRNVLRKVGSVWSASHRGRGDDDNKSLASLSFQTGDFLDVGIHLPNL